MLGLQNNIFHMLRYTNDAILIRYDPIPRPSGFYWRKRVRPWFDSPRGYSKGNVHSRRPDENSLTNVPKRTRGNQLHDSGKCWLLLARTLLGLGTSLPPKFQGGNNIYFLLTLLSMACAPRTFHPAKATSERHKKQKHHSPPL